jgi:hypothetical protein
VDLQRQLFAAEDQGRLTARAHRGGQQLPRLGSDPGGVALEVELVDELPAARAVLPAGGRIGPALGLTVADRGR